MSVIKTDRCKVKMADRIAESPAQKQMLSQYQIDVSNIRLKAQKLGLSRQEVDNLFTQSFMELRKKQSKSTKEKSKAQKICQIIRNTFILCMFSIIFVYILMKVHYPTSSLVIRNVQGLTYPTSRVVRFLSMPLIKMFSSLTNLYDESCLIENPYFYVSEMDCWPCEKLDIVSNLTDGSVLNFVFGNPFIVKVANMSISLKDFQKFVGQNKAIFDKERSRIKLFNSENNIEQILDPLLENPISSSTHFSWRIKRYSSTKLLRKLFPKPRFLLDRMGESAERFIFIDGIEALPYTFPNMECSYVLVVQSSGERNIVLNPSSECSKRCKSVSVLLEESYVLWYNWWYWRPVSMPTKNSTVPSITYINSYC